jgi:glyoxylase-like metal-dependent hydrolase (beta-lactamase superfamily II)
MQRTASPVRRNSAFFLVLLAASGAAWLADSSAAWSQTVANPMDMHWNEGAKNCKTNTQPPLEHHAINAQTIILRENLCATFEAPFMYLLVGSERALLIDTGDVAHAGKMPLAKTVLDLLPVQGAEKLPLLVVHTHRHLDHRAGDAQFANLPNVQVVGYDLDSVRSFYKFTDWPRNSTQIELGERTLDVLPTPGHNPTEVSFYDRNTGLFFSGDFLMPGRLLIEDTQAGAESAKRVAEFVKDRPVSAVLGGHIELDANGKAFPWESQYHPNEHALAMTKDDLLALPGAVAHFNGFYSTVESGRRGPFLMMNSKRVLIAMAVGGAVVVTTVAVALTQLVRHLRR